MDLSANTAYVVYGALLVGGLAVGFGLGLTRNRSNNRRARDLAAQLELAHKEREFAQSELAATREKLEGLETEFRTHRNLVNDHFAGASERLREFTIQYRAVYQHLAEGASALCNEGFAGIEGSFDALPPTTDERAEDERETDIESESESESEDAPPRVD